MPAIKYNQLEACTVAIYYLSLPSRPTLLSLADELGISYVQFNSWRRKYKEFAQAVKRGQEIQKQNILAMPPKYTEKYCKKTITLMSEGKSMNGAAACIGISLNEFKKWMRNFPQFKEAVDYGRTLEMEYWEKVGHEAMQGKIKNFNQAVWQTSVKARFGYGENVTVKGDADNPLVMEHKSEAQQKLLDMLNMETIEGTVIKAEDAELLEVIDLEEQEQYKSKDDDQEA